MEITAGQNVTIDLNGKTLESLESEVFIVNDGTLTITGDGEVIASRDNMQDGGAIWVNGANAVAVIKGGKFKAGGDEVSHITYPEADKRNDCIYVGKEGGQIYIEGGSFEYTGADATGNDDGNRFLVNQRDNSNAVNLPQCIFISGGQFKKFNPAAAETNDGWMSNPVNYVVSGKTVEQNGDWYIVK